MRSLPHYTYTQHSQFQGVATYDQLITARRADHYKSFTNCEVSLNLKQLLSKKSNCPSGSGTRGIGASSCSSASCNSLFWLSVISFRTALPKPCFRQKRRALGCSRPISTYIIL